MQAVWPACFGTGERNFQNGERRETMAEFQLPHDHGTSSQAASLHQEVMQVAHFAAAAEVFKQLSDPTRVRIFWLLSHQEACVINLAGHAGDVQPGRVAPSALSDGERPARQPPRRQGGLLPRGRHGGEPSAARDRRARHGDRLPGEGRGLSGLAGGDHPPRAHHISRSIFPSASRSRRCRASF